MRIIINGVPEEELPKCPECGEILQEKWENNGFDYPEGLSKWEVSYLFCPECGYKEEK